MADTHLNKEGYWVNSKTGRLIHRENAFRYIYLKNKKQYGLPFKDYIVHHIDGNKQHNHSDNLLILTQQEHEKLHPAKKEHQFTVSCPTAIKIIKTISKKKKLKLETVEKKVLKKLNDLANLVSQAGAAEIVAKELRVNVIRIYYNIPN